MKSLINNKRQDKLRPRQCLSDDSSLKQTPHFIQFPEFTTTSILDQSFSCLTRKMVDATWIFVCWGSWKQRGILKLEATPFCDSGIVRIYKGLLIQFNLFIQTVLSFGKISHSVFKGESRDFLCSAGGNISSIDYGYKLN